MPSRAARFVTENAKADELNILILFDAFFNTQDRFDWASAAAFEVSTE